MGYVLVVDDNFLNVKLLEARLQIASYDVRTAFGGEEALARMREETPSIVLLDVMMPGMNGYEVCQWIRQNPATAEIPVIMVSALDKVSDREAGLAAGADDYVNKPIEDDRLFESIRRLMDRARPSQSLAARAV